MKIKYTPGDRCARPEDIWGIDDEFAEEYHSRVAQGRTLARRSKLAIVAIARNAMPWLANTLVLVDELAGRFRDAALYVFENDSSDDTAEVLDSFAGVRQWVTVEHDTLGGADTRGFEPDRTVRLAACRTRCQEWVRTRAADADYVLVLDTDPHGGFSVDGVCNSVAWIVDYRSRYNLFQPGAMASYSLFMRVEEGGRVGLAQYDSWASRLNWWGDYRDHAWFHLLLPPVGSPPIPFNSAFGGCCLYAREAYLAGRYEGGDCEHVPFHRAMRKAGYQCYLNPGSRYVAILP